MLPDPAATASQPISPLVRRWAWILGIAGLIPFVGHTIVATTMAPPFNVVAVSSQILYAALILTFIGALHWGVLLVAGAGLSHRQIVIRMVWSIIPSLYAFWFAQITHPEPLPYLSGGLVVALLVDWWFYCKTPGLALQGFIRLRVLLTVVAVSCLMITWYAAIR